MAGLLLHPLPLLFFTLFPAAICPPLSVFHASPPRVCVCVCRFLVHASLSFKLNCITLMSDSMFSTTLTSLSLLPAVFSVLCSPLFFILQYSLSAVLCVDPLCLPDKWMLGSYSDLEQTVDSHFTIYTQLSAPSPSLTMLLRLPAPLYTVSLQYEEILAYHCREDLHDSQLMGF